VYYISPQLWAWRSGRMKTMRRVADRVLVIFEFEEAIYRKAGVPVQWVGHPLLDVMPAIEPREVFLGRCGLDPNRPVIALLPGSRPNELRAILPGLVDAALRIRAQRPDMQFLLARAPHLADDLLAPLNAMKSDGHAASSVATVEGAADATLAAADLALLASGTVTVQAALHQCPMIVVYRLSPVTYRLGRPFVHVDTFAMVNLVAGTKVVPELIQDAFTPEAVAGRALALLDDPAALERIRADLRRVRARLGERGASRRAAEAVIALARGTA
jgi:lipid-A-disaccharide synthase